MSLALLREPASLSEGRFAGIGAGLGAQLFEAFSKEGWTVDAADLSVRYEGGELVMFNDEDELLTPDEVLAHDERKDGGLVTLSLAEDFGFLCSYFAVPREP